jgi:flagellar biogenesis protein FliO
MITDYSVLKMLRMLAIRILAVWAVHRLAVTKRYYPSRYLIILNNAIIFSNLPF